MEQDVSYKGTGVYSKQTNLTQTETVSDSSISINVVVDVSPSQTTNSISLDPETYQKGYGFEEECEEILDENFDFDRLENNVKAECRGVTPDEEDQEAEDGTGYLGNEATAYDDGDYFVIGEDDYVKKVQDGVTETVSEGVEEETITYQAPEETENVESPAVEDETEYDGLETEIETPAVEEPDYEAIDVELETPEETPRVTLEALIRTGIILH
jgi:hypothetical protein